MDLGISSVKVILVNNSGRIVAKSSGGYFIYSPHSGWAKQNPEKWWKIKMNFSLKAYGKNDPKLDMDLKEKKINFNIPEAILAAT